MTKAFIYLSASSQSCTLGFQRSLDRDFDSLVALLRRTDTAGPEQWIFPEMQFTCHATLRKWNFRAIPGINVADSCRVHLTTWRRNASNLLTTQYERVSTTEGNVRQFFDIRPIFSYLLAKPIQVEPGDIVGIETGTQCGPSQPFDNIQSRNVSGSDQFLTSYRRFSGTTSFNINSSTAIGIEQNLIPLIQDTIGQFIIELLMYAFH